MDKITFLNELELALDDLPREEKDSIMHKYENLFYEEELKGISESQIIKKLNDPYHISKEVKARSAIHYASYKPTLANIVRAILASLSLGILSLFIILIPVVIIALLILFCLDLCLVMRDRDSVFLLAGSYCINSKKCVWRALFPAADSFLPYSECCSAACSDLKILLTQCG